MDLYLGNRAGGVDGGAGPFLQTQSLKADPPGDSASKRLWAVRWLSVEAVFASGNEKGWGRGLKEKLVGSPDLKKKLKPGVIELLK